MNRMIGGGRVAAVGLTAVAALCGLSAAAVATAGADPVAVAAAKPKSGKYSGEVGTFARIIFNVKKRAKVVQFNAGVSANCQRVSDGRITENKVVATAPQSQDPPASLKVNKKGAFSGEGMDDSGARWKVAGKFVSKTKAKGTFEASLFEFVFDPFGFGDGQLCAGSGDWIAKRGK